MDDGEHWLLGQGGIPVEEGCVWFLAQPALVHEAPRSRGSSKFWGSPNFSTSVPLEGSLGSIVSLRICRSYINALLKVEI